MANDIQNESVEKIFTGCGGEEDGNQDPPICEGCEINEGKFNCKVLWKVLNIDANMNARFEALLCLECLLFCKEKEEELIER